MVDAKILLIVVSLMSSIGTSLLIEGIAKFTEPIIVVKMLCAGFMCLLVIVCGLLILDKGSDGKKKDKVTLKDI